MSEIPIIAVLLPCYNEEAAIGRVLRDFREVLPDAILYVYDNNSTDHTADVARAAGAVVRTERLQGKGNVVRRMFADIEADVYVLIDGDDTYHAPSAPRMIRLLLAEQLDMVNGARITNSDTAYRPGHQLGNKLLTGIAAYFFGDRISDMLSGYRVFSRRFVKSFPALAGGFEIETELTVHALELRMPVVELSIPYKDRPKGSMSKLNTYKDGFRILWMIGKLVRDERPLLFFAGAAALLVLLALVVAAPIFVTYAQTGLVPRFPSVILATGMMLLASLSFACGLILDTVTRGRQELKRMRYLALPAPAFDPAVISDLH